MSETQDLFNLEENNLLGGNHTSSDDYDDMTNLSGGVGISIIDDLFMLGCSTWCCAFYVICISMICIIHKKTYCK